MYMLSGKPFKREEGGRLVIDGRGERVRPQRRHPHPPRRQCMQRSALPSLTARAAGCDAQQGAMIDSMPILVF